MDILLKDLLYKYDEKERHKRELLQVLVNYIDLYRPIYEKNKATVIKLLNTNKKTLDRLFGEVNKYVPDSKECSSYQAISKQENIDDLLNELKNEFENKIPSKWRF